MLFRDESASKKVCYLCKKKVPHDEWNSGDHRKKCAKRREESAFGRGGAAGGSRRKSLSMSTRGILSSSVQEGGKFVPLLPERKIPL